LHEGDRVIYGEQSQFKEGEEVSPQVVQPGGSTQSSGQSGSEDAAASSGTE